MLKQIRDFSKGINSRAEPDFLPEGFVVDAQNVEYNHSPILSRRFGVDEFDEELTTALTGKNVENFWVWYPPTNPTNSTKDYVFVFFGTNASNAKGLWVCVYETNSWALHQIIIDNIDYSGVAGSDMNIFVGDKLLITDNKNVGHYVSIDEDGAFVNGKLGIPAPLMKLTVEGGGAESINKFLPTDTDVLDTGMTIERGNILQLVYTVVDKFGNESNPSPITTYTDLQYRYPTPPDEAMETFGYYWVKATYSGLTVPPDISSDVEDSLRKFNIYRRDMRYTGGSSESIVFRQVDSVNIIGDKPSQTVVDTNVYGDNYPSYENDTAPIGKFISENSKVKYMANLKMSLKFPYPMDCYTEIILENNNSRSYIDAPIAISTKELSVDKVFTDFFDDFDDFKYKDTDWREHIRVYYQDRVTPMPVVFSGDIWYILIPYIPENTSFSIFVVFDKWDSDNNVWIGNGIQNSDWQVPLYGKFVDASNSTEWATQKVFKPNRVRSVDNLVCVSNEDHSTSKVLNRYDKEKNGEIIGGHWIDENNITLLQLGANSLTLPKNYDNIYCENTSDKVVFDINDDSTQKTIGIHCSIDNSERIESDDITIYSTGSNMIFDIYPIISSLKYTNGDDNTQARSYGFAFGIIKLSTGNHFCLYWGDGNTAASHTDALTSNLLLWDITLSTAIKNYYIQISMDTNINIVKLSVYTSIGYILNDALPSSGAITSAYELYSTMDIRLGSAVPNDDLSYYYHVNKLIRFHYKPKMVFSQVNYITEIASSVKDDFLQLMNFSPLFPNQHLGYSTEDSENQNISFETPTENNSKGYQNVVKWTSVNGVNFPDLWERKFKEPIKGMIPHRRKSELTTNNRMLIFGRNTLNVFYLTGQPDNWNDSTDNIIEVFSQYGLYSENSLGELSGVKFWFSEIGAIMFKDETPIPISLHKINIPLSENIIGFAIPTKGQYVFHDQANKKSYVYHLATDAWTIFTGLDLNINRILNDAESDKNLFLNDEGGIESYPSLTPFVDVDTDDETYITQIITAKYPLENNICRRFRMDFDGVPAVSTKIRNRSTTIEQSFDSGVNRMVFRGLKNGSWGESVQFTLTSLDNLKKIEYEIQGR